MVNLSVFYLMVKLFFTLENFLQLKQVIYLVTRGKFKCFLFDREFWKIIFYPWEFLGNEGGNLLGDSRGIQVSSFDREVWKTIFYPWEFLGNEGSNLKEF